MNRCMKWCMSAGYVASLCLVIDALPVEVEVDVGAGLPGFSIVVLPDTATSDFTNGAVRYAEGLSDKVILVDGEMLVNLMIDHGVGVTLEEAYEIKRMDSDYFNET